MWASYFSVLPIGEYPRKLCDIAQLGLKVIFDWCRKVGFNFNSAKTVVVPFTNRYKLKKMGVTCE